MNTNFPSAKQPTPQEQAEFFDFAVMYICEIRRKQGLSPAARIIILEIELEVRLQGESHIQMLADYEEAERIHAINTIHRNAYAHWLALHRPYLSPLERLCSYFKKDR